MLVNCYYYCPHNHSLLNRHLEYDLEQIAALGTEVVSVCVQESQLTNWHQQRLRNLLDRAHAVGLKVHAVPNRWAGLVAGWLDGFGTFSVQHPEVLLHDQDGKPRVENQMVACVNQPRVQEYIAKTIDEMFSLFDFDGLIWDEPHASVCFCEYCRERADDKPTEEWYYACFAEFIDSMSAKIKQLNPQAIVSLFVLPHDRLMLKSFLKSTHLDYLGSDGHVRSDDHQMHRMKKTIFQAHADYYPQLQAAGKKAFFLLEGQRHRDEDLANYLANLERAFALPMDHLMYYYSAHEMSPAKEDVFNAATWDAVRKLTAAVQ